MVPDVTVIVCTRDRPVQLAACLDALADQRYSPFDILVVDNGSAEPVDEICRTRGAACIREPVPGLTRARNLGARSARGEVVAYIDDDAVAEPDWLAALVREFADPHVAAVAGRTRYLKAQGDTLRMSDEDAPGEIGPRPPFTVDRSHPDWFTRACFGGIGDGNTMAFRRRLLTETVRFDERLGRGRILEGGDEHVAFMSLISDGYRVTHAPGAVVRHPMPADPARRRAKRIRDLRASVAYVVFVWIQFPGHRAAIARFLGRAVLKRVSREAAATPAPACLSVSQAVAAVCGGLHAYWQSRHEPFSPRVVTLR